MMRSMFSGVSSLRVHQTRMDVIANNIANVNTEGFKSQRVTFADAFYQNLQGATGPDPTFGRAGINPQQVGLGLNLASIDNLMHPGMPRRTDNALDVAIAGGGFFVVQDRGGAMLFTRAGRITQDGHWNLQIGGNMLMGWGTRECSNTPGGHAVDRGILAPISIAGEKLNMPSEPTTRINITGNLNRSILSVREVEVQPDPASTATDMVQMRYRTVSKTFFDSLGHRYTMDLRMTYHPQPSEAADSPYGYWTMEAADGAMYARDADDNWVRATAAQITAGDAVWLVHAYRDDDPQRRDPALISVCFMGSDRGGAGGGGSVDDFAADAISAVTIGFNNNGDMVGMGHVHDTPLAAGWNRPDLFLPENGSGGTGTQSWWGGREFAMNIIPISGVAPSATFGNTNGVLSHYDNTSGDTVISVGEITLNFTELGQRGSAQTSIAAIRWDGGGPGKLDDISIGADGTIMGRYSNGRDRILGQIPLAFFTNPAGLERVGNSFWRETANSGAFDGIGQVGAMQGGALEGSNVDLANEFTEMITTQRGFQAASRTITVSDEMLQELVNLRR
jgi:flagellar hook protein FlgE